jgi:putative heme transporter
MVPLVVSQAPSSPSRPPAGSRSSRRFLEDGPLGLDLGGLDGVIDMVQEQLGEAASSRRRRWTAAVVAFEVIAGILLLFVVLFFYLKDGRRLADGVLSVVPRRHRSGRAGSRTGRGTRSGSTSGARCWSPWWTPSGSGSGW